MWNQKLNSYDFTEKHFQYGGMIFVLYVEEEKSSKPIFANANSDA